MKVGIISDIHSNKEALRAVLEELDSMNVEKILCCGDLVGYCASPNETVGMIERRHITCVKGNHDQGISGGNFRFNPSARKALEWNKEKLNEKNKDFLRSLPERKVITLDNRKALLVHGSPRDPIKEYVYPEDVSERWIETNKISDYDLVIMGHTHAPFTKRIGGTLIINPGSVGQPRNREPGAHYEIIDTSSMTSHHYVANYDIEKAANKIKMQGLPEKLSQRLLKGV